ncbi:LOW QUALITY PROTEIN: mitochondrial dynamics protein MID49 [Neosynchiropus ocellatus]
MNFQSSRRRGEDGVAMVMDFLLSNARLVLGVGGAALLGLATLAVKRLIERAGRAAEEEKVASASPALIGTGLEDVVLKHVATATRQNRADLCGPTRREASRTPSLQVRRPLTFSCGALTSALLQDRLLHFHHTRAALPPPEVRRAQNLALDLCGEVQGFLRRRHPPMPLEDMSLGGSLLDDLQVVSADHVCLLVPLRLEAALWRLVPGEETLATHPLRWMVRRLNLEYFPRGCSYWDRCLVGGYLSAQAVVRMFSEVVMEAVDWPSVSSALDRRVRPVLGGPDLRLEIRPGAGPDGSWSGDAPPLSVTLLPLLRDADVVLTAQTELTSPWANAWHLSLYPWETRRLARLDSSDGGCRRLLLRILKAVCRLNPALRPLGAAPLANMVLHLSARESDWSQDRLDLRFRQSLAEMIGFLEQQRLPSFFRAAVNLLGHLPEDRVDQAGFMLYCAVSEPEVLLM